MSFLLGLKGKIVVGLTALAAFIGWLTLRDRRHVREGEELNQEKQEKIDHETANDIHDRVRDTDRVPTDELKFRD